MVKSAAEVALNFCPVREGGWQFYMGGSQGEDSWCCRMESHGLGGKQDEKPGKLVNFHNIEVPQGCIEIPADPCILNTLMRQRQAQWGALQQRHF
jgi:hypothetical protein